MNSLVSEDLSQALRPVSRQDEKRIALALSPDVAWPTLGLAVILPSAFLAVAALGLLRIWPLWACTPLLSLVSYAHYTLVHEAIHGNVVSRPMRLRWINTVVGWVGALGLGVGWPLLQRTHVLHHAHTNTDQDPDIYVKGSLLELVGKWAADVVPGLIPLVVLRPLAPARYQSYLRPLSGVEVLQCSAVTILTLALLAASLLTGRFAAWFFLWFAPISFAALILAIFFQWLPHHPFDRTDRYGNTRISLWAGGSILTLQQNLHLMHHLWPSVPFYNYGRLFLDLRTVLLAEGALIQGFGVGKWARSRTPEIATAIAQASVAPERAGRPQKR